MHWLLMLPTLHTLHSTPFAGVGRDIVAENLAKENWRITHNFLLLFLPIGATLFLDSCNISDTLERAETID